MSLQNFMALRNDAKEHLACADAWVRFLSHRTSRILREAGVDLRNDQWYGRFGDLRLQSSLDERQIEPFIRSLMLPEFDGVEFEFVRRSIHNKWAEADCPLNWFVPYAAKKMPKLTFEVEKPMTISLSHFKLDHRMFHGRRRAVFRFVHPNLRGDTRRGDHIEDHDFPRETTRQQMWEYFYERAVDKCEKELCFITEEPVTVALHKAALKAAQQKELITT